MLWSRLWGGFPRRGLFSSCSGITWTFYIPVWSFIIWSLGCCFWRMLSSRPFNAILYSGPCGHGPLPRIERSPPPYRKYHIIGPYSSIFIWQRLSNFITLLIISTRAFFLAKSWAIFLSLATILSRAIGSTTCHMVADGFVESSRQVTKIQTRHKPRTLNLCTGCGVITKIESNESRYLIAV